MKFEIVGRDPATRARAGNLLTAHGVIQTPTFMPVGTAGTVKGITQEQLEQLGVQMLLANTYHLYLRPGHEVIRQMGGLHHFMSWPHPILTDSGGFQVMSLKGLGRVTEDGVHFRSHLDGSSHFLSPERAMEIQLALRPDIMMTLDECVEYPSSHETLRRAVRLTGKWARKAKEYCVGVAGREKGTRDLVLGARAEKTGAGELGTRDLRLGAWREKAGARDSGLTGRELGPLVPRPQPLAPSLFGIVQGGTDKELRRQSAEEILEIGFDGYALGGLSVGETKEETYDVAEYTAQFLPAGRPRYLMGVGTPKDLAECVARGIDLFDCVMPTRNARNGSVFTSEGKLVVKNARFAQDNSPLDPACGCFVCRRYSRAYLRHLFLSKEMLGGILATCHNLYFYLDTMHEIRQAIASGDFGRLLSRVRSGL